MSDGRLTTHVLDTALGRPAAGIPVSVWMVQDDHRHLMAETVTNDDGRTDAPLLSGPSFGALLTYEIVFTVGTYLTINHFARMGNHRPPNQLFLDTIPIRFGVEDADAHYHVPLLLAPHGYSTYRGS